MRIDEGVDIAKKLNEIGVDAFVLKYRLNYVGPGADGKEPITTGPQAGQNVRELSASDGVRAVEVVRAKAESLKIDMAARSRHTGGVQITMCDSSVHFLSDSIDIITYRALSTLAGGETALLPN